MLKAHDVICRHLQSSSAAGTAWALLGTLVLRTGGDFDLAAGYFARAARLPGWRRQHLHPAGSIVSAAAFRALGDMKPVIRTNPITFGPISSETRPTLVTSADPAYFEAFAETYVNSARRVMGHDLGIHIHLFDPGDLVWETVVRRSQRRDDWLFGVSLSRETTGGGHGYYYVGRFVQLASIMEFCGNTCVVTDIDCVFVDNPMRVVEASRDAAFGLCYIDRYVFPWQNFRANMMVAGNTPEGRQGLAALGAYLGSLVHEASRFYYVDQAALMMLHYAGFSTAWITKAYHKACFQPSGSGADLHDKVRRTEAALRRFDIEL